MSQRLRRTPLYEEHVAAGGKIVPFAGYEMPVQYPTGIREEHEAVRERVGLFDVSHMGEFLLSGDGALDLIQHIAVNDASGVDVGQAQYSAMCREDGGVLDDLLIYRYPEHWMLVVNASNRDEDLAWVRRHAQGRDVEVEDTSDTTALLALQGPKAAQVLAACTKTDLDAIGYYRFALGTVQGRPATISRTGYTGEDGFELYVRADDAVPIWRALLAAGEGVGIAPAGLGARDSLRLEMGYALYGNDLDINHTPLESGLGWIVKLDKGPFVGSEVLAAQKERGVTRRLVGFTLSERGFPRPGYSVVVGDDAVGTVTSGTLSPTLGIGVGMAYVPTDIAKPGSQFNVRIRDRDVAAEVSRPPFYKGGSIKR